MTPEESRFHREHAMKDKADILERLESIRQYFRIEYSEDEEAYKRLESILNKFQKEICEMEILEISDEQWHYRISVRETDIALFLDHSVLIPAISLPGYEVSQRYFLDKDQHVVFHETKAEMVTSEEFGRLHQVPAVTIRQWIRRGKIHSAVKAGGEWLIPIIAKIDGRHRHEQNYIWTEILPDIPKGYEFLNRCNQAVIAEKPDSEGLWQIVFYNQLGGGSRRDLALSRKEKERLELFLISEPRVRSLYIELGDFVDKQGFGPEIGTGGYKLKKDF